MRRDSVFTLGVRFAATSLGLLLLSGMCWAQQTSFSVQQNPVEPSPLSQFSGANKLIDQLNHVPTSLDDEIIVSREIDLKQTLRGYAAYKKCNLNEAFAETASYLKMVPMRDDAADKMIGAQAFYTPVKQDIYRITAAKKFFNRLPESLKCVENGKRHLVIEVSFLGVPADNTESFKTYMLPGSYESFNNTFPVVQPYATSATYKNAAERSSGDSHKPQGTFVVASETKTKVFPTFMGRLNDDGVKRILNFIRSDKESSITMAPTITIIPGQTASISDAVTRPFVVGLNRVDGDFTHAHQPVIQSIEEGAILKVRATGENGKIRVDGDLALSQIGSVETYSYPGEKQQPGNANEQAQPAKGAGPVSMKVQVPEQKLKQVHLSTLVEEGNTIFIDPVFIQMTEARTEKTRIGGLKAKPLAQKQSRMLLMITPRFIEVNEQPTFRR